jgi:hypothetical protein
MDCKSLEYARREDTYEYLLKVEVLFIWGSFLAVGPHIYSTTYYWERKEEPNLSPTPVRLEGKGDERFLAATYTSLPALPTDRLISAIACSSTTGRTAPNNMIPHIPDVTASVCNIVRRSGV